MSSAPASKFDPAELEILWGRLCGLTQEISLTIRRTSFSMVVTHAREYASAFLDAYGNQIVQGVDSTPLFTLPLPLITREIIRRFQGRIFPGDVFIGNDPWLGSGHIPDVAIVTPIFHQGRLVAFSANMAHQADFGGVHAHNRVREVYEEGLFLPLMKLYDGGIRNETLLEIIQANVRPSELVLGDINAQVAANEVGARGLIRLINEYGLDDPAGLAVEFQDRSERAMRSIIRSLPDGVYKATGWSDSKGNRTQIVVAMTITGDEILVDFAGTGSQIEVGGANCTLSTTVSTAQYALKCVLAPHIPHNEGSTRPITITAPPGCILNCVFPIAVSARAWTAWYIFPPLQEALSAIVPHSVMAGPGQFAFARVLGRLPDGKGYNAPIHGGGGQGGSYDRDGMGGYTFPLSAGVSPVEIFEAACPAIITERTWLPDTCGAGQFRGGPAQRITVRRLPGYSEPVGISFSSRSGVVQATGMFGGADGTFDHPLWNGEPIDPTSELGRDGQTFFRSDADELTFHATSGAGFGDPKKRSRSAIESDIRLGLITAEAAARDYGYRAEYRNEPIGQT